MVNINKIKALAKEKGVSITFLCQESSAQNANTTLEITTRYIILTSYLHSAFSVL